MVDTMKDVTLLLLVSSIFFCACSTETAKRTGYEMMKQYDRQKCLNDPKIECPNYPSYNEYERMRNENAPK